MNLPTPIGLLQDEGVIGDTLRQLRQSSHTVLEEAETKDDPWTWLANWCKKNLIIHRLNFHKTFLAAASQKHALRRLGEVAAGAGSISKSGHRRLGDALKNHDLKMARLHVKKMATSILQYDKQWFKNAPLKIREIVRQIEKESYPADVLKLGRKKADENWKGTKTSLELKQGTKEQKIGTELTLGWLSVGDKGFPGYCFISDKILATMLGHTLPFRGLLPKPDDMDNEHGRKCIEDIRRNIGLKKAETIVTRLNQVDECKWAILDKDNNTVGHFKRANSFPKK